MVEEMGKQGLGGQKRFAPLKERQGLQGWRVKAWSQLPAPLSLHPWQGHTCEGWSGAGLTRGERLLTSKAPPNSSPPLESSRSLPWWWETAAMAPCAPPPLGLPGLRALAVVAAVGCQHPHPRGAPAQAPTLPPSQALTPGYGGSSSRGSGNLRGAGFGSRGPSLLFHKPGPSQEQCRT